MVNIKLIIFDFSGVCSTEEESIFIKKFCNKHNLDFEKFWERYSRLIIKAETGEEDTHHTWKKLVEEFNLDINIDDTIQELINEKEYYFDMLEFANSLRSKYKTALYSNYNQTYWEIIEKKIDPSKYFDLTTIAYKIKIRKPSHEGFKLILNHFKVKPEETIFTDDSEKNVKAAAELGIHSIHFKNKEQFLLELKKLGI